MSNFKVIYIVLISIFGFLGCSEITNSNTLDSDDFDTKEKRIEILQKEINANSVFENTEFELFNINGFTKSRVIVPGSSSLDYKFVVKVLPIILVDRWTDGFDKIDKEDSDINWTKDIIKKRKDEWVTTSQPEFFKRNNEDVTLVVYREDGVIFKRVIDK